MENKIYSKIYLWLFIGLLITFITGVYVSTNENLLLTIFTNKYHFILAIIELGLAIFLSARIHKMKPITAKIIYILYTILSGLTFSSVFIVYELSSIILVFLVTAILFLIFAVIGHFTKVDLSKIGTYLFMMLIGVIICTIINLFLQNSTFDILITSISIIVFLGFIAYDIQKIKRLKGYLLEENLAIIGAFELYLDFINIFIDLLRLFGKNDD